ncbi:MAG: glutaredoxin [Solirubrobacteraceae bacterium]|nr:glutaredoxin [Patulibacter sp.]
MTEVVVYSKVPCPYCVQVERLLTAREIPYEKIDLTGDTAAIADLSARTGMFTLPQVFVDGELIGGYTETAAADKSGKLAELVGA